MQLLSIDPAKTRKEKRVKQRNNIVESGTCTHICTNFVLFFDVQSVSFTWMKIEIYNQKVQTENSVTQQ